MPFKKYPGHVTSIVHKKTDKSKYKWVQSSSLSVFVHWVIYMRLMRQKLHIPNALNLFPILLPSPSLMSSLPLLSSLPTHFLSHPHHPCLNTKFWITCFSTHPTPTPQHRLLYLLLALLLSLLKLVWTLKMFKSTYWIFSLCVCLIFFI